MPGASWQPRSFEDCGPVPDHSCPHDATYPCLECGESVCPSCASPHDLEAHGILYAAPAAKGATYFSMTPPRITWRDAPATRRP
jgi:hypothetical protein